MTKDLELRRLPPQKEQEIFRYVFDKMNNVHHCRNGHTWVDDADAAMRCCNGWVRCWMSCMEKFARKSTWPNANGVFTRFLEPATLSSRDREAFDLCFGAVLIPATDRAEIERLWALLPHWLRKSELQETDGLGWLGYYYAHLGDA